MGVDPKTLGPARWSRITGTFYHRKDGGEIHSKMLGTRTGSSHEVWFCKECQQVWQRASATAWDDEEFGRRFGVVLPVADDKEYVLVEVHEVGRESCTYHTTMEKWKWDGMPHPANMTRVKGITG